MTMLSREARQVEIDALLNGEDRQRIISRLGRLRRADWQRLDRDHLVAIERLYDEGTGR